MQGEGSISHLGELSTQLGLTSETLIPMECAHFADVEALCSYYRYNVYTGPVHRWRNHQMVEVV